MLKRIVVASLLASATMPVFSSPINTTNLLLNPGGEAGSLVNWTAGGDSSPRLDSGTFDAGINPHAGSNDFLGGTGVSGSLAQVVTLVGKQGVTAAAIDQGNLLAGVSFWEQSFNQVPTDAAYISLAFFNGSSNIFSTVATPEVAAVSSFSWSNYVAYFKLPAGTRYVQYTMNFIRHNGSDLDAFVDDNSLTLFDAALLPRLSFVLGGGTAVVFWPTNSADGFVLQSNTNLASTNWLSFLGAISTSGGTNQITVLPSSGSRFFRLAHP